MALQEEQEQVSGAPAAPSGAAPGQPVISYETISALLPVIDLALIVASSILATVLVLNFFPPSGGTNLTSLYGLSLVAGGLYVFRMRDLDFYESYTVRRPQVEIRPIVQTWGASLLVLLALIYLFKLEQLNMRRAFGAFVLIWLVILIAWRALLKFGLRKAIDRNAIGRRNVLLIGLADEFAADDSGDLLDQLGAAHAERFMLRSAPDRALDEDDRATVARAIDHARSTNAEEALVLCPWADRARLGGLREALRELPISARLLPDRDIRALTMHGSMGAAQLMQVELQRTPLTPAERGLKRCLDIVLSLAALIVLSPLLLLAAIAIRLESPGPVIFKQRRVGFNRQEFRIYKFRSMRVKEDGGDVQQAVRGDARITRVGRFLRASSIDELPQLFNVLKGEMSLVGPRPHALRHDIEFEADLADYAFRRHVKPGITGWAQCHGRRGPTPTTEHVRQRVEFDLWYINHWSFGLDLYILIRTVFVMFRQKNAF